MMTRPDVLFMAEYIKNVLYFATIRQGKTLKSTGDTHYFSIDNELVYENYYSDFGPLNLGCVYKYCKLLNEKIKQYLNKQIIVHYTTIDPKKKANAAFLLGSYGVLYLSLPPKDALKPLLAHGQSYRPFQDATQGDSSFTISVMDCLQAIKKAKELGFFNFQDFNYEDYESLDKIQGGDLNWIVPGKFLAFIGPVDYSVSLYHPPELYIDYFLENNVKIVIRLNKRLYDGNVFTDAGIVHYDLFFPDGSCPPRHILLKFLQISEESDCAIAVHCKAGLGRTGSLIGCYLIKHYRMTSHEAIGWMRICRPGSVIGHQQGWLEQLEAWLMKQGNLYRKRMFNDADKLPYHHFGVYSIAEKTLQQRPIAFHKSPSPPPIRRQAHSDTASPLKPLASRNVHDKAENDDEEIFLTSCDLTVQPAIPMTQMKGCIIKNNTISEEHDESGSYSQDEDIPLWKKILCCQSCINSLKNGFWMLSVRCARVAPEACKANRLCGCLDMAADNKTEKEQYDWRVRSARMVTQKTNQVKSSDNSSSHASRQGSGAGEPRLPRSHSKSSTSRAPIQRNYSVKSNFQVTNTKSPSVCQPTITTFRTTNGPAIKNVNDARNFLLRSSKYNEERERHLQSTVTVTPHSYAPNHAPSHYQNCPHANIPLRIPSSYSTASRSPTQPVQRRRLGRSPSPPSARMSAEHTRATNTTIGAPKDKYLVKDTSSKCGLREALSRLKLVTPRDGSIGAASVGAASLEARRDAPSPKRAPSVRSDERPLATQGDLLNSIKFQKRLRDTLHNDKFHEKVSTTSPKDKTIVKKVNSRTSTSTRLGLGANQTYNIQRENQSASSRMRCSSPRPASPKGRRSPHSPINY